MKHVKQMVFTSILSLMAMQGVAQVEEPEQFRKYQLISSEGFACKYSDEQNRLILA